MNPLLLIAMILGLTASAKHVKECVHGDFSGMCSTNPDKVLHTPSKNGFKVLSLNLRDLL